MVATLCVILILFMVIKIFSPAAFVVSTLCYLQFEPFPLDYQVVVNLWHVQFSLPAICCFGYFYLVVS